MTIKDIRPADEVPKLEKRLRKRTTGTGMDHRGIFWHKKKNGEIIQADIQSTDILYKGQKAKVILANDITERLNYIKAIEEQNEKLKEISRLQSHVIRAPLAKITGLIPLINDVKENMVEREKNCLFLSANELDQVIGIITDKTNIVEINRP